MNKEDQKKSEEIKKLVMARLDALPSNVKISVGSEGSFSKQELMIAIDNDTEIGKKMIQIELEYLRKLKEGLFYAPSGNNH